MGDVVKARREMLRRVRRRARGRPLTRTGRADGRIDPGDVIAVARQPFEFAPFAP